MASKILSFICHVPGIMPGAYPAVPMNSTPKSERKTERKAQNGGHFTAIYENDRFARFKYISNAQ